MAEIQYSRRMPDMSRNPALAGQTVSSNGMNVTYDDNGYAVSAVNYNHPLYAHTERSVPAQSKESALRGEAYTPPDTSGLLPWNDGWNANHGNGLTYAQAYQKGLLGYGPGSAGAASTDRYGGYDGSGGGLLSQYLGLYSGQDSAYAQALSQQQAANDAAVRQAVNSLESRKTDTNNSYAELFRQAYIDNMNARKNIDQRLAAQGITGGAAESTLLGLSTAYSDALRQGEQSRINAIGELDRAISDARLTGDVRNAQAAADSAKETADSYANALKTLISRQDTLDARRESYAREDAAENRSYAYRSAMQLINSGYMPGAALLAAAGIDSAAARSLAAAAQAEKAGEEAKPALTAAQTNAAIMAGHLTPNVLYAYEYWYGEPYRG